MAPLCTVGFEKVQLLSVDKNGIPFHDRERITNFQKYHEKITAIFQIEKREGKYSNQKKENIPNRKRKIFQLEKGKHSNQKKETILIRKMKIFQLENIPIRKYSNQKKENIPIRKRKPFQLEKGKYSNQKKENIPIRKRKIFQ